MTATGSVKCWGRNPNVSKPDVTDIPTLGNDNVQVVDTGSQVCTLTNSGTVKCATYGSNTLTNIDLSDIKSISSEDGTSCAVTNAGGLKCWGNNPYGQLGNGTTNSSKVPVPVDVVGLSSGVASVSVGGQFTCALTTAGSVKCWGHNSRGQLGNGTTTNSSVPVDVPGLSSGVVSLAAGSEHACALLVNGEIKCWGQGSKGQLGNGTTNSSLIPTTVIQDVDTLDHTPPVTVIKVSSESSGTGGLYKAPVTVSVSAYDLGGSSVAEVHCVMNPPSAYAPSFNSLPQSCNFFNPVTISKDGTYTVYAASVDSSGNQEKTVKSVTFQIQQQTPVTVPAVSLLPNAGGDCAVTALGGVRCWGSALLGNGSFTGSIVPVDVPGLSDVKAVDGGLGFTCALINNGDTKCWGSHFPNQNYSFIDEPTSLTTFGPGIRSISSSTSHSCAVTSAGAVKCWGENGYGQLGNGKVTGSAPEDNQPVDVVGLTSGVSQVTTGLFYTCALTTAGGVKCWGSGEYGQLGNGVWSPDGPKATASHVPVDVIGLSSGVKAISSSDYETCALTNVGGVKCWGGSDNVPYDIPGLTSGVKAVRVSNKTPDVCALTEAGGVKCWGRGNPAKGSTEQPKDVPGLTSGVKDISYHCALLDTGAVKCWEPSNSALVPVDIANFGPATTPAPTAPSSDPMQLQATLTPSEGANSLIRIEVSGMPAGSILDGEYQIATAPACGRNELGTLLYQEFTSETSVFTEPKEIKLEPGSALLASVRVLNAAGEPIKDLYTQRCLN